MNTYKGLPIFRLNVADDDPGIRTVSLVECPAMEMPMIMFSEDKKNMNFSIQDLSKHNILTLIARTDFPVLRATEDGNPYYVIFTKEVTEKLCQKLMKDGMQQNISLNHSGKLIDGIQLQEVFLKDSSKGISPIGYEDAAEGSLFGIYHITDDQLWKDCLEGKFTNVSLESYFTLEKFNKIKNNRFNMSKLKDMIKKLLLEFNSLSTNIAELYWEEDTELMVGYKVFVEDESGNKVPAMDGEYISDENKIKVAGGTVTEIERREVDDMPVNVPAEKKDTMEEPVKEEPKEEPAKEEPKEEPTMEEPKDDNTEKVAELEKKVADLETKLADLEAKLAEIATTPAAQPVIDEFENIRKVGKTGDKNLDKRLAIAAALKN